MRTTQTRLPKLMVSTHRVSRKLAQLVIVALCALVGSGALSPVLADSLIDDFATNPFDDSNPASPRRWCERDHHVHWQSDSTKANYKMIFAVNGDCCAGFFACGTCVAAVGQGGSCGTDPAQCPADVSSAATCRGNLITDEDYVGDERSVKVAFGLPVHLSSTCVAACADCPFEQVSVAAAAHPSCDARIEARITRLPSGQYALQIVSFASPLTGHPECAALSESSTTATFNLTATTLPSYDLALVTARSSVFPTTKLTATANVVDRATGAVLATATRSDFTRPGWYDTQGQGRRFAIGGVFPNPGNENVPVFDDFAGSSVVVPLSPTLPSNPNGATPVDQTVATDMQSATRFLYEPASGSQPPLQTAYDDPNGTIVAGTIKLERAAVIRGSVSDDTGPLAGVSITILGHQELGRTHTRQDGRFDMAVNGGGRLTVVYEKPGFSSVHRQIDVPWQDYVTAPDVIMVARDPVATVISLGAGATALQTHRATAVTDSSGTRRATLLVAPGTTATMTLPGGGAVPLGQITVRATEYTVGVNGPKRMPAELPPESAYTYAVELSIDEADAAGASRVDFPGAPVIFYVENFLGFPFKEGSLPAGPEYVPAGYYDREKGAWVASENGRFVRIVSETGSPSRANLDLDGDSGSTAVDVAEYATLGISDAEREKLADLYAPGQVLWRVPMTHFTPWDLNWGFSAPGDGGPCECSPLDNGDGDPDDPQCGSIIGCQSQTLGEGLDVTGTPFRLVYDSRRTRGYAAGRSLLVYLRSGSGGPVQAPKRVELEIDVAGKHYATSKTWAQSATPESFVWDGTDAYDRPVVGRFPTRVRIGYVYDGVYTRVPRFGYAGNGLDIGGSVTRREVTFWETFDTSLEVWDARAQGLGGWTLDQHHAYDPVGRVLHMGDGRRRSAKTLTNTIRTVASNTNQTRFVAGGPDGSVYYTLTSENVVRRIAPNGATSIVSGTGVSFSNPAGVAIGPDDALYVADAGNRRIQRIVAPLTPSGYDFTNGTASTVVGCTTAPPCAAGFGGDGGSATGAAVRLNAPSGIAFGPDGSVYFADSGRIRRVTPAPDRIITTVAGDGTTGSVPADGLHVVNPSSGLLRPIGNVLDVAVASDGSIVYPQVTGTPRVRKIGTNGIFSTLAGNGATGSAGDGGPALQASLSLPRNVRVGPDGTLYVVDDLAGRVRRVGEDGIITTLAGGGTDSATEDLPAGLASLFQPQGVAVGPDGRIFISTGGRIRRVAEVLPSLSATSYLIPAEDGREVYEFDGAGRHLRTRDSLTGADLYSFGYTSGLLTSVTDRSGNVTQIPRSAGIATAIQASGGQVTSLAVTGGNLTTVTNPAGEATQMTYVGDGLLRTFTDPRGVGHTYTFTYDSLGRLDLDQDPEGGAKDLARSVTPPSATLDFGFTVDVTTAMGRLYRYVEEKLKTGIVRRTNTMPDGTATVLTKDASQARTIAYPDGTIVKLKRGPEVGRFGMQAPVWSSAEVTTPAMRAAVPPKAATITSARTVTLSSATNPFSLTAWTETSATNGRTTTRSYNPATRVLTETSPAGRVRTTTLDALSRVTKTQESGLNEIRYAYDTPRGRLQTIKQGVPGVDERVWTLGYDVKNRLTSIANPLSQGIGFAYDLADRVTTQTQPNTTQIGFGYDAAGNMSSLTPPGRPAHGFEHAKLNLEKAYLPPDPSPAIADPDTRYAYNLDRQLDLVTRPRKLATDPDASVQIDLQYESGTDRLSKVVLPTGDGEITYAYDSAGRLQTVTGPDPAGTAKPRRMTYGYDGFLPLSTTWGCAGAPPCPAGTVEGTVSREYDDSMRLVKQRVNGASEVTYGYDADDLLTTVTSGTALFEITRDPQKGGLVTATKLTNGAATPKITDTRTYDAFGDVATYEARYNDTTLLYSVTYTRDGLGRITTKSETIAKASGSGTDTYNWAYTYDTVGRLDTVTKNSVLVADYEYDANGNRIAGPGLATAPVYDDQDRLITYGPATYVYAPNGELASKTVGSTTTTYAYDALGALRQASLPNADVQYVIDGTGRRVGRTVSTVSPPSVMRTGLLFDGALQPAASTDDVGNVTARYVQATQAITPDVMIGQTATYRVIGDRLGSVRLLVDIATGGIAQRLDYDEYGVVTADSAPGVQPFGFAGGVYDPVTGLVRFGVRDYDSSVGRWTRKDPVAFLAGDPNLYRYVNGNPVLMPDSNGLGIPIAVGACLLDPACSALVAGGAALTGAALGNLLKGRSGPDWPPADPPTDPPLDPPGGDDGWRQQCIDLYVACQQQKWAGPCGQCLNKCTAQHEWDFDMCKPRACTSK